MGRMKPKVVTNHKATKMKLGKNKKKTWKQIQHNDVDEFLDDMRQDERLGGIRNKSNTDLFTIDKKGVDSNQTWTRRSIPIEKSHQGPLINIDDLTCFNLLKPHTQVPDPIIKRNRVKLPGEGKSDAMKLKDINRQNKKLKHQKQTDTLGMLDPWDFVEPIGILDSEWVPNSVKRHNLRPRIAPPVEKYKTSELPAIALPHPGYSYNPTFDDHQNLLKLAVSKEVARQRKERNLIKATAILHCDSVDVKPEETSSDEDNIEDEKEKKPDRKPRTRQGKRKEREEKEKVREQKMKRDKSIRMNEVFRIKTIQKEIKTKEIKQKIRLAKMVEKKIHKEKFGQKNLSKFKYEEPGLNPAFSEDLQGSLVGIPSDNRILFERFKSLQKRNIIEPRLKNHNKRKNKLKKYQRSIDKMPWEKTGVWNNIKIN